VREYESPETGRAALAALLAGELDFYTAIGSTARAALRGLKKRGTFCFSGITWRFRPIA